MFGFFRTFGFAAALALTALAAAEAQTTTPIRLGYIPVMGVAQIFVAEGEGWTKAKGLDIKFASFESGPNMIQALDQSQHRDRLRRFRHLAQPGEPGLVGFLSPVRQCIKPLPLVMG